MKNQTNLQDLKTALNKPKDEGVYNLCAVMELVGGYDQLMNLPMSAISQILKYIEFVNKKQEDSMPKMPGKR